MSTRTTDAGFGLAYSRSRSPSELVTNGTPDTVVDSEGRAWWCSTGSPVMYRCVRAAPVRAATTRNANSAAVSAITRLATVSAASASRRAAIPVRRVRG